MWMSLQFPGHTDISPRKKPKKLTTERSDAVSALSDEINLQRLKKCVCDGALALDGDLGDDVSVQRRLHGHLLNSKQNGMKASAM